MKDHRILTIIMTAVLLLLCFTGCSMLYNTPVASPTPDPNATVPPEQVVDAEYKLYDAQPDFTISYQAAWVIRENKTEDGESVDEARVVFTVPEAQNSTGASSVVYPTLNVLSFPIPEGEEPFSLESYARAQMEDLKRSVYRFTLLKDLEQTEINGQTAFTLEYVGTVLNASNVAVKQMFLASADTVYILTYGASSDAYNQKDSYTAVATAMMESFRLRA